ncbi:MAG: PepSY domain-containing protein [Eubacteriales bacterium]|jgi:uncharacterized membrane protein YkoI
MKKIISIAISLLLVGALAGCSSPSQNGTVRTESYISAEEAKTAALNKSQVAGADMSAVTAQLQQKNGVDVYEVDFSVDGQKYHCSVDALTGSVIEVNQSTAAAMPSVSTTAEGQITADEAKQIALDHAGVQEGDTTFLQVKPDYDDGIAVYDVEFYVASTNTEYDYEVDAASGAIRSFDYDAENYVPASNGSESWQQPKSEEQIRQIALAKVPGATQENIRLELDSDDGRLCYEGKIVYDNMKYEFEIDAYSGAILEWEAESVFD